MSEILIVEDKESLRHMLQLTLEHAGYKVSQARDAVEAAQVMAKEPTCLILTDLRMPKGSGLDVLRHAQQLNPEIVVIVMTAYGSVDEAVQAMKDGAYDFIQKPIDTRHLLLLIDRAFESIRLRTENLLLKEEYSTRYGFPRIIGESEGMKTVGRQLQQVAATEATVLLLGESGTGKEMFARAIHYLSQRKKGPFIALNCAALPENLIENELFGHEKGAYTGADSRRPGKFELARGGTIFLDEVGEIAFSVQAKLLRALQERTIMRVGGTADIPIDVRIVAATNKDLTADVTKKNFREDLYFRLAVFPITIPPLRERAGDIETLAKYFVERFSKEIRGKDITLSTEAIETLKTYSWPGNVRELENCIERACILCDGKTIKPSDLALSHRSTLVQNREKIDSFLNLSGTLEEVSNRFLALVQRKKIEQTLRECGFNKSKAAEALQISYKTLLTKIRELKID
ncbi:MAG: sigma-54-dependent Fis family transcriptional regulator [Blastocatellia bacterium]|nr:sigma-54-dependent Fis family transcriptional regulator [Blastocatellia bacterium]